MVLLECTAVQSMYIFCPSFTVVRLNIAGLISISANELFPIAGPSVRSCSRTDRS